MRDRVVVITSAEDMARCKPDPVGYLRTLAALRLSAGGDLGASQCLVVEDILAGVASAKAAGKRAVGVFHAFAHPGDSDPLAPTSCSPSWRT